MLMSSLAIVLALLFPTAPPVTSAGPWHLPEQQLDKIDLRNPQIADSRDLALLQTALVACQEAVPFVGRSQRPDYIPDYYYSWAARQSAWWRSFGAWYFVPGLLSLRDSVVLVGLDPSSQVSEAVEEANRQVQDFLAGHFGLTRPRYAVFVRLFDDWADLPGDIAEAFGQHRGMMRVSGLTVPPRFVIIPRRLPSGVWGVRSEVLVDEAGRVRSRLTLMDLLVHELVHANVHALLAEKAAEHGEDPLAANVPLWLDEGLAVYTTEKLRIEPGTKPISYYRYSAPLHYLADEWGEEELRDFVRTAVLDGYPTALRHLGLSEEQLRQQGDAYLHRPQPLSHLAGSYAYLVGFLVLLVLVAAAPFVVSMAWRRLHAAFWPASEEELEGLWLDFLLAEDPSQASRAARRFLQRWQHASPDAREVMAWRRCKLWLLARL
ncbi:MAG: hypothetical protein J7M26_06265 [Armatimonadetes bacterium]|nr:hypothetical protein [Armatimonadota bacterium]